MNTFRILDLSGNRLVELGGDWFQGCRSLNSLLLHHSAIQFVKPGAFKPFTNLHHLDLSHNFITDLASWREIETVIKVQTFQFSGNDLSNISNLINLHAMERLERLDLESCNITTINSTFLATNKELKYIQLDNNYISNLSPEFFSKQVFLRELR